MATLANSVRTQPQTGFNALTQHPVFNALTQYATMVSQRNHEQVMSDELSGGLCVAPMLSLPNNSRWVGSHGSPGKPLYALKQRLVSSTITAPPICMSQHAVTLIQAALLDGRAAAQVKGVAK